FDPRKAPVPLGDPEGGGHGRPPFFDRTRMSCRKIPTRPTQPVSSVGEGPFFWLLFFGPAKKSHPPKAEASALHPFKQKQKPKHARCACALFHTLPNGNQIRRNASVPFVPPKPNEFDSATSIFFCRATCGT